jgi:hypothetical protein
MRGQYHNMSTDKSLRNAVIAASRNESKSAHAVITAIVKAIPDWHDTKNVTSIMNAYKHDKVCTYLNLKLERDAAAVYAKSIKQRTPEEATACKNANALWSSKRQLCGAPSAQTGATRAPRAPAAPKPDKSDISPAMLAVPKAKSAKDVDAFLLRMVSVFTKYQTANAKLIVEGRGELMSDFVKGVHNVCSAMPRS